MKKYKSLTWISVYFLAWKCKFSLGLITYSFNKNPLLLSISLGFFKPF
jgi:hypothetical protein